MPTEVLFSFDTEDYTTERNADAILALANMFTEEGVTANFAVVGLLAQQLLAWDRQDVIEAMKPHVLGYHSYCHSIHPLFAETCDREDSAEAARLVTERESKGLPLLRQAFGDKPVLYAVPPGNDVTSEVLYYYASAGIPMYFGGYINDDTNTLLDYCGLTQVPYTIAMESIYLGKQPMNVDNLLDDLSRRQRVIIYHHPNMSVKTTFWDIVNYKGRNRREFGDWAEAPDRPLGQTIAFWTQFRAFLRRLKADPRFVLTDARQILSKRQSLAPAPITPDMLPGLAAEAAATLAPLKSAPYSIADLFNAAVAFLQGQPTYTPALNRGFLDTPSAAPAPCTVTAAAVRTIAQSLTLNDFIPTAFDVNGVKLGPADFLFAMVAAFQNPNASDIAIRPRPQTVDVSALRELASFKLKGWLFADTLEDKWVSKRLRLQAWTWRNFGV